MARTTECPNPFRHSYVGTKKKFEFIFVGFVWILKSVLFWRETGDKQRKHQGQQQQKRAQSPRNNSFADQHNRIIRFSATGTLYLHCEQRLDISSARRRPPRKNCHAVPEIQVGKRGSIPRRLQESPSLPQRRPTNC